MLEFVIAMLEVRSIVSRKSDYGEPLFEVVELTNIPTVGVRSGSRCISAYRMKRDVCVHNILRLVDEVVPEGAIHDMKAVDEDILM